MIFNSLTYILFLSLVTILFWLLRYRERLIMLFLASIVFYGFWKVEFITLMLVSAITDYFVSLAIHNTNKDNTKKRKLLLSISLVINLGLLLYFKYLIFFVDNFVFVLNIFDTTITSPELNIILPLGISFYTFQTISYTVDVYRGIKEPIKDFILYGCYVMFFPQLVAGPILRVGEVVDQLKAKPVFRINDFSEGLKRILYGLFLKVFLADNISGLVDNGFSIDKSILGGLDVWTLAFLFGLQIYFDFSAYSHIAIGSAKLMGINFPENFNYPYAAISFKDFWKRWHISLSSWIRDYLYLPLSGAKFKKVSTGGLGDSISKQRKNRSLFLTWAIMGFWHGANWTFVVWGLYHAICIYIERTIKNISLFKNTNKLIGWLITLPVVMLSWIPFRAQNLKETFQMFSSIFIPSGYFSLNMRENVYLITFLLTSLVMLSYLLDRYIKEYFNKYKYFAFVVESIKYSVLILLVFTFLRPIKQFIYFQF